MNWPLRGVIVLLSCVRDDAGIGLDFGNRLVWFVGVVGVGVLCGQMSRLVMILNWAASRSNCFAQPDVCS